MKNNLFRSISVVAMVCLLYLQGCTINNNEDDDGVDVTDTGTAIRRSTDNIGVSTDSVSDSIAGSDSESVTDTASIGTDEGDTGTATETASDDTASAADTAIVDTQTVIDTATPIQPWTRPVR